MYDHELEYIATQ